LESTREKEKFQVSRKRGKKRKAKKGGGGLGLLTMGGRWLAEGKGGKVGKRGGGSRRKCVAGDTTTPEKRINFLGL